MSKLKINIWLNIVIISISIFTIVTGVYSIFSAKLTITGSIGYVAPEPEYYYAVCSITGATNGVNSGTLYATNNTTSTTKDKVKMDKNGYVTFGNLDFASSSDTITFNINVVNESEDEDIAVDIDFESLNLTGITRTVSTDYLQIIRPSSYTGTIADNDASIKSSESASIFTFTFTKISGSTPSISGKLKINIQTAKKISTNGYFSSVPTSKTCTIGQVPACDETTNPTKTITIPSYFYDSGRYIKATTISGDEPDPITNINTYTNVIVNNGIKYTYGCPFSSCANITAITLPSSLESIVRQTFNHCSGLIGINIPSSVKSLEHRAFESCSGLTSVIFGKNSQLTFIGPNTFSDCISLKCISIPSSVTSIDLLVFNNCTSLTDIIVEEGNTVYDSRDNCNAIIETASNTLLYGCKNTTIPSSVTSIGSYAFAYCSGLTSITIPSSVTSIGSSAFERSSGLTSIIVEDGNTVYDSRENCNAIIESATNTLLHGCKNTTIPSSVTRIGSNAFSYHILTSITIPSGVTSMGDYAFYHCTSLTSVTFGGNSQLTSIGSEAFSSCSCLTSITIPNSVTSIGEYAFSDTPFLTTLKSESDGIYTCSDGKKIMIKASSTGITSAPDLTEVYLIADSAFYGCSKLTNITIPNSVTSIGKQAFYNCSKLTRATFEVITGWTAGTTSLDGKISSTDYEANATLLTDTYKSYTWTRS